MVTMELKRPPLRRAGSLPVAHQQQHRSSSSSSPFHKRADREIAALQFLTSIPMSNERTRFQRLQREQLEQRPQRPSLGPDADDEEDEEAAGGGEGIVLLDSPVGHPPAEHGEGEGDAFGSQAAAVVPGKQLEGPAPALVVAVPAAYRHRYLRSAAVMRQWEEGLVRREGLLDGRLFLASGRNYPVAVASVIAYRPGAEETKRLKLKQADERGAEVFDSAVPDWRGVRHHGQLHAEWAPCAPDRDARDGGHPPSAVMAYDPLSLDDPGLAMGKHRQVNVGGVGPVIFSVIQFAPPKQLREEINEQFAERHPDLPPSLSLSKIRRLKRQAVQGCLELGVELGTLALAFVYFERLTLQGIITKSNRRLAIATCLVLAFKWNEPLVGAATDRLPALLQWIERVWYTSPAQVFRAEFGAFSLLNFGLHVPLAHVQSHFFRIVKSIEMPPKSYLGEHMLRDFLEQAALEQEEDDDEEDEEGDGAKIGRKDGGATPPRGREGEAHDVGDGEGDEDEDWALSDTIHGEAPLPARRRRRQRHAPALALPTTAGSTRAGLREGWGEGVSGRGRAWALAAARALRWRGQGAGGDGDE